MYGHDDVMWCLAKGITSIILLPQLVVVWIQLYQGVDVLLFAHIDRLTYNKGYREADLVPFLPSFLLTQCICVMTQLWEDCHLMHHRASEMIHGLVICPCLCLRQKRGLSKLYTKACATGDDDWTF